MDQSPLNNAPAKEIHFDKVVVEVKEGNESLAQ